MKVALVLGSGGARGYAHIGVIEELESRGHEIVAISGTSMGAVIGGMYAAGKLTEFTDWVTSLSQLDVVRLMGLRLRGPGVVTADAVMNRIDKIVDGVRIENLRVPFTAVATNIETGREVWFQTGNLAMAIRASMAVPGYVTPVSLNGQLLSDGALVNPVPMEPVAAVPADFTVAVSLSKGRLGKFTEGGAMNADDLKQESSRKRRGKHADDVEHTDDGEPTAEPHIGFDQLPDGLRRKDVTELALNTMQGIIERYRWAANPASVRVDIPHAIAGTFDLHRAGEIIEVGRAIARQTFDDAGI